MFLIKLQKNSVFGHFAIICEIPPESFALHSIHKALIIILLRVSCQTLPIISNNSSLSDL